MARGSDRRVLSAVTIYNEIEPYAADWLENLIAAGHIEPGTVDRRSIEEITPDDVRHARQFHTFAGIGLWSYALRLAGWPPDVPVWTGSCPCQPWSSASRGRAQGQDDPRHLWPVWFRLIRECVPPWVFGEQVSGSAGLDWFGSVSADLESAGYAVAGADLPACGGGAPHRRQRLFFVAHAHRAGNDDDGPGSPNSSSGGVQRESRKRKRKRIRADPRECDRIVSAWEGVEWLPCSDGKSRPTQPGLQCLVDGYPARVARLRAIGNAIVPQVAAAFIRSAAEAVGLACQVD